MSWDWLGGAIAGLGSVAGAYIGANAAGNAADAGAAAANTAAQVSQAQYDQTREDYAPYRDVGQNALYQLAAATGTEYEGAPGTIEQRQQTAFSRFNTSPDYNFRLNQGIQALDRSAASRGRLMSGAQDKAITGYGQNLASSEWNNWLNRQASLAGIGQTATNSVAQAGGQNAANVGNATMAAGDARASGYMGQANAINQGINNLMYAYGRYS